MQKGALKENKSSVGNSGQQSIADPPEDWKRKRIMIDPNKPVLYLQKDQLSKYKGYDMGRKWPSQRDEIVDDKKLLSPQQDKAKAQPGEKNVDKSIQSYV